MIVRSAEKPVSKTRSKPIARNAAVILPATSTPGGSPNSSPRVTDTLGACWTTTIVVGVVQRLQHFTGIVLLGQRPGRADHDALPAVDAAGDVQAFVERRADRGSGAAAGEVDRADLLDLFADPHALAAEDALGRVADDRRTGHVDLALVCVRRGSAA